MLSLLNRFRKMKSSPAESTDAKPHLTVGRQGEELARRYLEQQGFRILACNYRVPLGEIDLIAEEGGTVAFIEVKARTGSSHGHPLEAVTAAKQRQLARVALHYLSGEPRERPARFDVVSVQFNQDRAPLVELTRNAFEMPSGM